MKEWHLEDMVENAPLGIQAIVSFFIVTTMMSNTFLTLFD